MTYIPHRYGFLYYNLHLCPRVNITPQSEKQEQLRLKQRYKHNLIWILKFYKYIIYFQKRKAKDKTNKNLKLCKNKSYVE